MYSYIGYIYIYIYTSYSNSMFPIYQVLFPTSSYGISLPQASRERWHSSASLRSMARGSRTCRERALRSWFVIKEEGVSDN